METTKNNLTDSQKLFFDDLSKYLDNTPIYFFGSIQRDDYFPGKSDIDVDIFTDNEQSIINKMQHFLHAKKSDFKKFVWRLNSNNNMIYGYKIMFKNPEDNFNTEFSIYNENAKEDILNEHRYKMVLPFYINWLLIILKNLYYTLNLIDKHYFRYLKKKLLTIGLGLPDDDFSIIDRH